MPEANLRYSSGDVATLPRPNATLSIWRCLLGLSRNHGMHTLARIHQRMYSNGQVVTIGTGCELYIPPDPHFFGFALGRHEQHVRTLIEQHVWEGDFCLDVGANIGYFAVMLAKACGASGRVIAFEPVAETFAALEMNSALAKQRGHNLSCIRSAVSDQAGELRIVRREFNTYHGVERVGDSGASGETTPATTIDEVLAGFPSTMRVKLVKIDVEGHEAEVLRGMMDSLRRGAIERLVIEVTPGDEARAVSRLLGEVGGQSQVWDGRHWTEGSVAELAKRTDVLVEFRRV